MFDRWVRFFREVGFPAAVAVFVLWRVEDRLSTLERQGAAQVAILTQLRDQRCAAPGFGVGAAPGASGCAAPDGGAAWVVRVPGEVGFRSLSLRGDSARWE